jgi:hypothetical protein
VEVGMAVQAWTLDFPAPSRHQQFSDAEFAAGRVGVGTCALRDMFGEYYYQPIWLFHVREAARSARVMWSSCGLARPRRAVALAMFPP